VSELAPADSVDARLDATIRDACGGSLEGTAQTARRQSEELGRGRNAHPVCVAQGCIADDIYTQRLALSTAAKALPIGNRAELGRWRGEVRRVLCELVS
jgi:hypothetical protein